MSGGASEVSIAAGPVSDDCGPDIEGGPPGNLDFLIAVQDFAYVEMLRAVCGSGRHTHSVVVGEVA